MTLVQAGRPMVEHPNPEYWAKIRTERIKLALERCEGCYSEGPFDCHHRTYVRFGCESLDDLRMLCRACHEAITSSVRDRRYQLRDPYSQIQTTLEKKQHESANHDHSTDWDLPSYSS